MGTSSSRQAASTAAPAPAIPGATLALAGTDVHTVGAAGGATSPRRPLSIRETVSNMTRNIGRRRQSSTSSAPASNPGAPRLFDDDLPAAAVWCFVKAKTRMHNSNKITRKSMWFEAKPGGQLTIGRKDGCDMILDDDRCAALNARLVSGPNSESVILVPEARLYRLIGMGMKPKNLLLPMTIGTVIKVGSVSLEVTALCADDGENFVQRFVGELKKKKPLVRLSGDAPADSRNTESHEEEDDDDHDDDDQDVLDDDETPVCYICWGGADDPVPTEELNAVRTKNPNPLIRNPCGKCSGSSRYVHLQCMLTWIKSSGSGHCSICNGALPQHFSSPPPNLELKVVRHRRGQSWTGTRRFRISFSDKSTALIGRDPDVDVRLSDRSVCGAHAQISFDKDKRQFFVQDHSSLTGTFILLTSQMELPTDEPTYVKIGRTTLSLRVSARRTSLIRGLLPSLAR